MSLGWLRPLGKKCSVFSVARDVRAKLCALSGEQGFARDGRVSCDTLGRGPMSVPARVRPVSRPVSRLVSRGLGPAGFPLARATVTLFLKMPRNRPTPPPSSSAPRPAGHPKFKFDQMWAMRAEIVPSPTKSGTMSTRSCAAFSTSTRNAPIRAISSHTRRRLSLLPPRMGEGTSYQDASWPNYCRPARMHAASAIRSCCV